MRNRLLENKEYSILSRSIDNASKCDIVAVDEDYFSVKLQTKGKYEVDESVELFTMTSKGQLYFETIVKDVQDDVISMWFPISYKYLQRREYSRITAEKTVSLVVGRKTVDVKIVDISAGGLKVITKEQLVLSKEYKLTVEIDNKPLKCKFEPIRIEVSPEGFIASGKFNNITNLDRIALVQYCFRKQIENSNK